MTFGNGLARVAAPLALVGLISACGGVAVATPRPAAKPTPRLTAAPRTSTAAAGASSLTAVARHQYASEVSGPATLSALHRVGRDQTLLRDLRSGNLSATRAYVQRQFPAVWYHWHVARMRILQGSRVVVETGVPFAVAPAQMTLHGAGGRALGTLQVSIQDEIGFVRLIHRHHPVDVVVRGQGAGHVRSSLPAAAQMQLPSSGSVTIGGRRYLVSSFHETAWANEPVTVWILQKG